MEICAVADAVVGEIFALSCKGMVRGVKDMIAGAAERKEIYKEFRLFEAE